MMTEYDKHWELLGRRNLEGVSYDVVRSCAEMLAQLVPQNYRAGKMVSDLGVVQPPLPNLSIARRAGVLTATIYLTPRE